MSKKCTAWAVIENGVLVHWDHIGWLPTAKTSELFITLKRLANNNIAAYQPDRVAFEYSAFQKGLAVEQFHALAMAVKVAAHKAGVPCYKVPTAYVKKHMTGKGNAKKPAMIQAVVDQTGIDLDPEILTPDSDIADAIAVGLALRQSILDGTYKAKLAT